MQVRLESHGVAIERSTMVENGDRVSDRGEQVVPRHERLARSEVARVAEVAQVGHDLLVIEDSRASAVFPT